MGLARTSGQSRRWLVTAAVVVLLGIGGSLVGALLLARNDVDRARNRFTASADDVATSIQLAIQHEDDLITSASALVARTPWISNASFLQWTADVHALERYPELQGMSFIVPVTPADLPTFAAQVNGGGGNGEFVAPTEVRPVYCFMAVSLIRPGTIPVPASFDFCNGSLGDGLRASRDSGAGSYQPVNLQGTFLLGVQIPVYRDNNVPTTVEQRRSALLGWIGMGVTPRSVLLSALQHTPGLTVVLRNHGVGLKAGIASGPIPTSAATVDVDFHNGWIATVYGPIIESGIPAHGIALLVLLVGSIGSILIGAFIVLLATGRARAERLVHLRTDQLRHQALHDSLTGLANRALVADRADQLLARSRRTGATHAALYLDLDGFKNVNDSLGHDAGDSLLQAVAARLTSVVREADTIARMGGDEFVVLIDAASLDAAPELVAERILDVMRQPFEIAPGQPTVRVSTSIGIATGDRDSADELLRDADVAMYEAKASGKDAYAVFRPEMQSAIRQGLELELDIRSALEAGQYRLVYQPVYNLDDLSLISVEALLRWEHPTHGVVMPDTFIPILERTGQIIEVGRWVLGEACQQMASWHARGSELSVSVNVSARQFGSDAIVDHVREALEASGLPPTALTLEITETALMRDLEVSAQRLEAIKAFGVQVAIDDFGTGYSSLAYLRRLPVDSLKIDRSFISDGASAESQALIRTIVRLGRDLGLKTLAEGVETAEQVDQLRGDDVDEAQGYLLARPLDAATIESTILLGTLHPTA